MNYRMWLKMSCLTLLASNVFAGITAENKTSFHAAFLYLQPNSNNLKYAVFVSGNQPYYQSWHNQTVNPDFSSAFALGANYAWPSSSYNASIDWLHVGTSDSDSKQASQSTVVATVQFVAPPYDVGPAVFGIKRGESTATSNFNNVEMNVGRMFDYGTHITGRVFGGLAILNINQNVTTTFSDYAGSPEIPNQAYALPADPNYYFTTKNTSSYLGIGPDVGFNVQYEADNGFGVVGQCVGALTVGTIRANDAFTSASTRLMALGINPSTQEITVPNAAQLVPGFDSKLGLSYAHAWHNLDMKIEGGYYFAYYINAISTISPDTLVQAGVNSTIPEFATGTMAINSTTTSNSPYSLRGPYLDITMALV